MRERRERLAVALGHIGLHRTPKKIREGLTQGAEPAIDYTNALEGEEAAAFAKQLDQLEQSHVDVLLSTHDDYPRRLRGVKGAPPVLFIRGNQALLASRSVGMCGSRNVSDEGLAAARACGTRVANMGRTVVSGYARGLDTETHVAALEAGGRTVMVLAEGILRFREKKLMARGDWPDDRRLIVSQFPPLQSWHVGAAMARNAVISGLSEVLVVVEAAEDGGTLDAGKKALSMGRPVIALQFSNGTPAGNEILLSLGAHEAKNTGELAGLLDALADGGHSPKLSQLTLPVQ